VIIDAVCAVCKRNTWRGLWFSSVAIVVNISFKTQYDHEKNGDVPGSSELTSVISHPGALT